MIHLRYVLYKIKIAIAAVFMAAVGSVALVVMLLMTVVGGVLMGLGIAEIAVYVFKFLYQ